MKKIALVTKITRRIGRSLFPIQINNQYMGFPIAKWVLYVITILTIIRTLIHMLAPDGGAQSMATIPLNTFTINGSTTVILLMALWGVSQLQLAFIYIVVLWRYQAWIPFMYILIFLEYTLRAIFMHFKPVHTLGMAPGHVADYVMIPLALVMFFLSLSRQ